MQLRATSASEEDRLRLLIRLHFAPRLLAYGTAASLLALEALASEEGRGFRLLFCAYCLAYPLAAQAWARRAEDARRALRVLFLSDPFHSGIAMAALGFALMPSGFLIGINLVNAVAFGGFREVPRSASILVLGTLLARLALGPLPATESALTEIVALSGLVLYNLGLGALVHRVTQRLREATRALRERSAALAEASRTDPLTGVRNRRDLPLWLAESGHSAVGYALLDIDHFKQINDRHGHEAGDRVLSEFARRLARRFGDRARVLRWGGEEFLLAWPYASGERLKSELGAFLSELRAASIALGDGIAISIRCSVGAVPAEHGRTWQQAIVLADEALYEAKRAGRDRLLVWGDARPIAASEATLDLRLVPELSERPLAEDRPSADGAGP
ncbi:MAG: hypothetical protein KatS3mg125_0487 [Lysobacterales bacterium]|nr:MAG: hypothetical protein KatS3mg125_0487 [Xanthomonadales bacterium]